MTQNITDKQQTHTAQLIDWVNPSKRGGTDRVFQGLAGLVWRISWVKSLGPALPARGKSSPSQVFYSDSYSISYRLFQLFKIAKVCGANEEDFCCLLFSGRTPVNSRKTPLKDCNKHRQLLGAILEHGAYMWKTVNCHILLTARAFDQIFKLRS